MHRDAGLGVVVLGHREGDPLERGQRQLAVTELGAEAGVGAQRGRRAGQDAEEVRELPPGGERAPQHRHRPFRGGQVVVDLEPAH